MVDGGWGGVGGGGGGGGGGWSVTLKYKHNSCQQSLQSNWKNGHHTLTHIKCHSGGVNCLQYDDEKLVTAQLSGIAIKCLEMS